MLSVFQIKITHISSTLLIVVVVEGVEDLGAHRLGLAPLRPVILRLTVHSRVVGVKALGHPEDALLTSDSSSHIMGVLVLERPVEVVLVNALQLGDALLDIHETLVGRLFLRLRQARILIVDIVLINDLLEEAALGRESHALHCVHLWSMSLREGTSRDLATLKTKVDVLTVASRRFDGRSITVACESSLLDVTHALRVVALLHVAVD